MPQSLRTGSFDMNSGTSSQVTSHWPFGLFMSLAILAINLLGPIPAEAVSFVFWKDQVADDLRPALRARPDAG